MNLFDQLIADPVPPMLTATFFALLWSVAALHKLLDWSLFRQQVIDYRIVPERWATAAAALLPAVEALVAMGWLFGASRNIAAVVSVLLLSVYAGAIASNLLRGRNSIDCGCGTGGQMIRPALVLRNGLLSLLALPLAFADGASARPLIWTDWLTVEVGALVAFGLYIVANQLLANMPPQRMAR